MTHELGHWCGLADLYDDVDYWLTMYGYGNYEETYKRDLGLGDILGLRAVYGEVMSDISHFTFFVLTC